MTFGEWLWWLLIVYLMFAFFMVLFRIIADVFRSDDMSGWAKAGWVVFLIIFPIIAMLIYVGVRGKGMAARSMAEMTQAQQQQADYIRTVAGSGSGGDPASQIQSAHDLLTKGAITQAEFDALKAKALA